MLKYKTKYQVKKIWLCFKITFKSFMMSYTYIKFMKIHLGYTRTIMPLCVQNVHNECLHYCPQYCIKMYCWLLSEEQSMFFFFICQWTQRDFHQTTSTMLILRKVPDMWLSNDYYLHPNFLYMTTSVLSRLVFSHNYVLLYRNSRNISALVLYVCYALD